MHARARAALTAFAALASLASAACASNEPLADRALRAPLAPPPPVCARLGCEGAVTVPRGAPTAPDPAAVCDESTRTRCTDRALELWESAERRGAPAPPPAIALLDRACALGDVRACLFVGRLRLESDREHDAAGAARGERELRRACDDGEPVACEALAARIAPTPTERRLAYGAYGRRSPHVEGVDAFARLELEAACWRGGANACFSMGLYYDRGIRGFPRDLARSARAYAIGCAAGSAVACNNLANAVYYGDGVEEDAGRAAALYEKACRGGEAVGCANVGFVSEYGDGVKADFGRARAMYLAGCSGGSAYACLHAMMLDAYRSGVPHEPSRARAAFERGCSEGKDARACAFAAILYEDGKPAPRDDAAAARLMKKACGAPGRLKRACDWLEERRVD